jgi:phosphatidylglycerophosphate synthase
MLDGWARRQIDPGIAWMARALVRGGLHADAITVASFVLGIAAGAAISFEAYLLGLALLLASRLGDGLDGAVARLTGATDRGGFLDIVLDFAVYGAIPLGFVIADPSANAVAGAFLIFTFYVNGASFLAFAIVAEKRKLRGSARGRKSIFFTTGLAEASETILVFVACCLAPQWFPVIAWVFGAICLYTALSRIVLAWRSFGPE